MTTLAFSRYVLLVKLDENSRIIFLESLLEQLIPWNILHPKSSFFKIPFKTMLINSTAKLSLNKREIINTSRNSYEQLNVIIKKMWKYK